GARVLALKGDRRDACERAAKLDQERLEREARVHLELLRVAPGAPHDLARVLGAGETLRRRVLAQLLEPVGVDDRSLGAGDDDDQVAVPGRELVEGRQELLALGAASRAPHPLLGL